MIYLLTSVGLTPAGSSTVHIYTQTIYRTTQSTQTIRRTTQLPHKQHIELHNRHKQYIEQHSRYKQYREQHNSQTIHRKIKIYILYYNICQNKHTSIRV